ncbi:MAG TPA: response regulator [Candidatus Binatia bacterium]|nr:response regulator [Candidatus Binatia bacterium]
MTTETLFCTSGYGAARPLSVLIVDDEPDSADSIAMLLERWNHSVRVAYDPRRALEIFQEQRPDLVILDIALPGMDGYQLAVRLRAEEHQAVLVALTGYSDRRRALAAGFDEFYEKPLDPEVLRELVARVATGRSVAGTDPRKPTFS